MVLTEDAVAGTTVLKVGAMICGLQVGALLIVNAGQATDEVVTVAGFGSILLESALAVRCPPSPPPLCIACSLLSTFAAPGPTTRPALDTQSRLSPILSPMPQNTHFVGEPVKLFSPEDSIIVELRVNT